MARAPLKSPIAFGLSGAVITPGASDLTGDPKAIVCTSAGNVTIVPFNNDDATTISFVGCAVGYSPPYIVRRVTAATGTWATVSE